MSDVDRRSSERFKLNSMGRLHLRQAKFVQSMPYICNIRDISGEGVCFETDLQIPDGGSFTLSVSDCDLPKAIELYGDVVWSRRLSNGRFLYGAKLFTQSFSLSVELQEGIAELARRRAIMG